MYSQRNKDPLHRLVEEHSELVARIVHHMMARLPASVCADDLYQAGMEGLLDAAKRFKDDKGASFKTFASIRIRGAILDEMRRGDWCPRSVHRNTREIAGAMRRVEGRTGTSSTDTEIAGELDISVDKYHSMLKDLRGSQLYSLDSYLENHEEGLEAANFPLYQQSLSPDQQAEHQSLMSELAEIISLLPEKEQLVLSLYYSDELNLREIGEVMGVSESRVSQIHSQAAARIRSKIESK
ncbi:MAG: RNA polymerase sigma factor FliA [Gammaproteobacteria bacterium]|nr:RNA polymerase sigma factor FliA [Gammaproteobacteria bacterium]